MDIISTQAKAALSYIKTFVKWLLISIAVGCAGGIVGSIFHKCLDLATETRLEHSWIIYFLPLAGVLITVLYRYSRSKGNIDTNRVIEAVQTDEKVPFVMAPLIFVSTVITQLFGGSAGREGAALQLGGSIGYNTGRMLKLGKNDMHIIVMAGMSSVFAALFGTPLAAVMFALEVVCVGYVHYAGFLPCVISASAAYKISLALGVVPVRFKEIEIPELSVLVTVKSVILAFLCATVSIIFCVAIKKCEHYMGKLFSNTYIRAFAGGLIIVVLTLLIGNQDYNGAGMDIVSKAIGGEARPEAFILKIVFTAITISAGFKGGEIVPTLFIGSTFGCVAGALLGLPAGFGAAIGFTALFCGVVNCPVASVILAAEVFGSEALLIFAIAAGVSYMMSGYFGLYHSQRIVFSKLTDEYIDIHTK